MRNLVIDFDVTVLLPLILFTLIVLWNSIRVYRWPSRRLHECDPIVEGKELTHWKQLRLKEKWRAKCFAWFSGVALLLLCAVLSLGDKWKLNIAYPTWQFLQVVGIVSFIIAALMAWGYVERQEHLKLVVCLSVMLLAAASTLHFFHQTINSRHVIWPHSSEDNSDEPDNN